MIKKLQLSSGNWFFYHPGSDKLLPYGVFLDTSQNEVLGGVLGREAKRKFKNLAKVCLVENETYMPIVPSLDLSLIEERAGGVAVRLIRLGGTHFYCDAQHAREANACEEREKYYRVAGLADAYDSYKSYTIWAFVLNHLYIFGGEDKFRRTFFRGSETNFSRDEVVYGATHNRYTKEYWSGIEYKAPAAYIRKLLQGED